MRTSVLVASFALLAIALFAPAAYAGSVEVKASDKSKFQSATATAAECAKSVKVTDGVNSFEKSTSDKQDAASTCSGEAENNNYQFVDGSGNSVLAKSSKKAQAATKSASSASSSVVKSVKAALPCGCK